MRQRVSIARAFAVNPEILLCDEPFSALDEMTARDLRAEFVRLVRQNNKTAIFITHQLNEAMEIGDRVMVFHRPARIAFEGRLTAETSARTRGRRCATTSCACWRWTGRRNNRGRLDLDFCAGLQQPRDDDQRHRRKMPADDAAIGARRSRFCRATYSALSVTYHVSRDEMPRLAAGLRQHCDDIRSACSTCATKSSPTSSHSVPADLAGDEHLTALGDDAVGIALRRGPVLRLQNFEMSLLFMDKPMLSQFESLDLACLRLRQGVDELDRARIFVRRDRRLHVILQPLDARSVALDAGLEHDKSA